MGNTIDYNPYDKPYVRADERNGTHSQQLWFAAGNSAVFSQVLMVFFISSWLVVPVNWSMIYCFIKIGRVRSDMFFGLFWNVFVSGILTASTGAFENRNAFVWIKNYSLVAGTFQIWNFKYMTGYPTQAQWIMYVQSFILHGLLTVNILEASVWEVAVIGQEGANVINAIAGFILGCTVPFFTYMYGVSVVEYYDGRIRAMRSNLTPTWIIAYTLWNVEYNAVYHPDEATFYIFATLLVPLGGAFWAGHDWLETRAYMLLHAINLRVLPWGGNGILASTVGLWEYIYLTDGFRYTISVLALLTTLWSVFEMFCIFRGKKWFDYGLRKELILFDIVEPYPPESIAPIIHRVLGVKLPTVTKPHKVPVYVAGIFSRFQGAYKHWGGFAADDAKRVENESDETGANSAVTHNPTFDPELK